VQASLLLVSSVVLLEVRLFCRQVRLASEHPLLGRESQIRPKEAVWKFLLVPMSLAVSQTKISMEVD
jgi:hypothetical protein